MPKASCGQLTLLRAIAGGATVRRQRRTGDWDDGARILLSATVYAAADKGLVALVESRAHFYDREAVLTEAGQVVVDFCKA